MIASFIEGMIIGMRGSGLIIALIFPLFLMAFCIFLICKWTDRL